MADLTEVKRNVQQRGLHVIIHYTSLGLICRFAA